MTATLKRAMAELAAAAADDDRGTIRTEDLVGRVRRRRTTRTATHAAVSLAAVAAVVVVGVTGLSTPTVDPAGPGVSDTADDPSAPTATEAPTELATTEPGVDPSYCNADVTTVASETSPVTATVAGMGTPMTDLAGLNYGDHVVLDVQLAGQSAGQGPPVEITGIPTAGTVSVISDPSPVLVLAADDAVVAQSEQDWWQNSEIRLDYCGASALPSADPTLPDGDYELYAVVRAMVASAPIGADSAMFFSLEGEIDSATFVITGSDGAVTRLADLSPATGLVRFTVYPTDSDVGYSVGFNGVGRVTEEARAAAADAEARLTELRASSQLVTEQEFADAEREIVEARLALERAIEAEQRVLDQAVTGRLATGDAEGTTWVIVDTYTLLDGPVQVRVDTAG